MALTVPTPSESLSVQALWFPQNHLFLGALPDPPIGHEFSSPEWEFSFGFFPYILKIIGHITLERLGSEIIWSHTLHL